MINNRTISAPLTKKETIWGFAYLAFEMLLLPSLLLVANMVLGIYLDTAQLNFAYYCINLLAIFLIFHRFLGKNIDTFSQQPLRFLKAVLFGLGRYYVWTYLVSTLVIMIDPTFVNINDATINGMVSDHFTLMAVGTIALVPPVEECLFRGLIFRNLYHRNQTLAYVVSTVAFSALHIISYLGVLTPMQMLLSFLQYLPAGMCLAWAYVRADSIFAPILIHAIVNAVGMHAMR